MERILSKSLIVSLLALSLSALIACNKTAENTNKPVIISGFSFTVDNQAISPAGTLQIEPTQVLTVKVSYTDPDAGANPDPSWYKFTWSVERVNGSTSTFNPNDNFVVNNENPAIWTAPDVTGFYKFRVEVRDFYETPSMETVVVEVSSNKRPLINSLDVSNTNPFVNQEITITVDATDPDGNLPLEYVWQASGGYFTVENDSTAKWLSPASGSFQITVNVNDQAGGTASRSVPINVQANHAPVIEGWNVDPGEAIAANGLATITVTATDVDGDNLEFNWSADYGTFSNVDKNVAKWRAPATAGNATVTCVVKDNKGGSDTANIVISVL
jgi:hypothetical protein